MTKPELVVSNYKWTLIVHRNLTAIQQFFDNKLLERLVQTIHHKRGINIHCIISFRADIQIYISLLTQIFYTIKDKIAEIFIDMKS